MLTEYVNMEHMKNAIIAVTSVLFKTLDSLFWIKLYFITILLSSQVTKSLVQAFLYGKYKGVL